MKARRTFQPGQAAATRAHHEVCRFVAIEALSRGGARKGLEQGAVIQK
jgi:hypothetical protein